MCDEAENLCITQNPCEEDNTESCQSAADSPELFNDYHCVCKVGFTGRHCEVHTYLENNLEFTSK